MTQLALDSNVQVALVTAGGTVAVALVGVLVELVRRQGAALSEVAENVQVAREHVENSHGTNLRDDIDSLMDRLDRVMESQEVHGRELGALRTDITHERRERLAVAERLDDHVAQSATP
ncbi:DUF2746 domain-containing protein [Streptomyces sp. NPDC092295]|uniref:DUF2746 domain-containing protein n=1 Tax=Streptomyces sp. NPDC092295 TaxID=3366011 RepID=UPI00381C6E80